MPPGHETVLDVSDQSLVMRALCLGGWKALARIQVDEGYDIAAARQFNQLVIRLGKRATGQHYAALSTMLSEGPFTRAILVYCEREGSEISDEIETWWIGDIEELAASLAAEARVP